MLQNSEKLNFLRLELDSKLGKARTHLKILNHMDVFKEKHILGKLMAQIDTLPEPGASELAMQYLAVPFLAIHPTDLCNLSCIGCVWGQDVSPLPNVRFPIGELHRLLWLAPKAVLISGGGEPTIYKDGRATIKDFVSELYRLFPGLKTAMITNGTFKPEGNWPDKLDWIRVSIDAATPETYLDFRRRPTFSNVLKNYLAYLDHDIEQVGVGFLYSNKNIFEYAAVAKLIYELVQREKPEHLSKVNIQYRALHRDPPATSNPDAINDEEINQTVDKIVELAKSSPKMEQFLREQTNVVKVLKGNTHPIESFSHCYYMEARTIVRANGDLRPCCVAGSEPELNLGNIISDPLIAIAKQSYRIANLRGPSYCSPEGCRWAGLNHLVEKARAGQIFPSNDEDVSSNLMY